MTGNAASTPAAARGTVRVRVFIDYWNLQLSLNEKWARATGVTDYRFRINWRDVGSWLAHRACETAGIPLECMSFEGVIIYASYNPESEQGRKYRKWAMTWLNRQPGVQVACRERKPRSRARCSSCHAVIGECPHCGREITSMIEKGVDTLIATDMIRLAWENAYDLAVLATSDSDLVPAVEFLNQRARKVVQAGFPPQGMALATACWASFDVFRDSAGIERKEGHDA